MGNKYGSHAFLFINLSTAKEESPAANFIMNKDKICRKALLRVLMSIMIAVSVQFNTLAAEYNKYVGESFSVPIPDCPVSNGYVNSYSFSCKDMSISVDSRYGLAVINKYFAGTLYIECFYQYIYYINQTPYSNTSTAYYSVSCRANEITISAPYYSLSVGDGVQIESSFSHTTYSTPQITYRVSDPSVISVSSTGYVTALKPGGPVTVSASSNLGDNTSSITFDVEPVNPTGVYLPSTLSLYIGESQTLVPELDPANATSSFTWNSDDTSIATVSSTGKVTGISDGQTKIRVKTNTGGYTAVCNVTVKKRKLTLTANPRGGVYPEGTAIELRSSNSKATIYYTVDGKTPSENSTVYTGAVKLEKNITLKAVAKADKYIDSDILNEEYEIQTMFVSGSYPVQSGSEVDKLVRPSITFGTSIYEGKNLSQIALSDQGNNLVEGNVFLHDKELIFVPDNSLEPSTRYVLSIPENAVVDNNGQGNKSVTLDFKTADYKQAKIMSTDWHSCVKDDGSAWAWDLNNCYWLQNIVEPQKVATDVIEFSPTRYYIKTDNTLWCWGSNDDGCLDNGAKKIITDPVKIADGVIDYQTYGHHGILKQDGSLWLWGSNKFGAIGNGTYTYTPTSEKDPVYTPYKVMSDVVAFSLSGSGALALKSNHDLYAWGDCVAGKQFSDSYSSKDIVATPKLILSDVISITSDSGQAFAIKNDDSLWGWGYNKFGTIGNGTTSFVSSPVKIMDNVKKAKTSIVHSMALKNDGSVWCWGSEENYGIGLGENISSTVPKKVAEDAIDIYMIDTQAYYIKSDNSLWGWGKVFPSGSNQSVVYSPILIMDNIDETIFGYLHSSSYWNNFVKTDGSLWVWESDSSDNLIEIIPPFKSSAVESLGFVKPELVLAQGESCPLQPILIPASSDAEISGYYCGDDNIVSVSSDGIVTAENMGTTKIRVDASDLKGNCVNAYVTVTVVGDASVDEIPYTSEIEISSIENRIIISNKKPEELVNIYSIDGRNIYSGKSDVIFVQSPGVYLVCVGNFRDKVMVRK